MTGTRRALITRRALVASALAALPASALAARGQVVTILGDSITAGLGLPGKDALPNQLHLALEKLGVPNLTRGAGISGDTTADGAGRMDFSIRPETAVVVIALGGNDLLRGFDPKTTRANLAKIIARVKQRHMGVVLCGLKAPPQIGAGYAKEFNAVFPSLAAEAHVALYPDLLAGVGRNRALLQSDGIHPNARGVQIIAGRLAPVVAKVLKERGG
jgi:acyl-CoA thioesterase-1